MNTENKVTKNERLAGVLMPIASLPSKDGVGGFGKESYRFVDSLSKMGISIWQILPLNPLGFGNSPYQPFSSFAGEELYIDINLLEESGYLPRENCSRARNEEPGRINYESARKFKEPFLKKAYQIFWAKESNSEDFLKFKEMEWVYPYAVFMALKKQNSLRCWNEWPKDQQDWILNRKYDISPLKEEIQYQMFLQYIFLKQWMDLKHYANRKGIRIMGDIPFYVGIDSLDVWGCRENFLLDVEGKPSFVAGVPPDYFSAVGQRWGNPIYNWEYLEKNQFTFWINRLSYSSKLYDIIRIDHFRAFDTYWKIPASCETAVEGEWIEAPGYKLFDTVFKVLPDIQIVAEDLGDIRDEVLILRDHYQFIGMNIAEFSFLLSEEPKEHQLIYTGTHDNQTVKSWYKALDKMTRKSVQRKLNQFGFAWESVGVKMLRYVYGSKSNMAIIPVMDIMELDDKARLNTPGTVGTPNWEWRLEDLKAFSKREKRVRKILMQSGRL